MTPKSAHPRTSRHQAGIPALGPTAGSVAWAPVVPLTLTADTRGTSTTRNSRPVPGPVGPVAAQRRRWPVRPGRGRRRGQLHRSVPDGRNRPPQAVAALEAAIPDAAALVFACLGIALALALHGRRALRARALNLASVAASVLMNALAAEPGWHNLAIWALPPVAYALASDTLIGVVRAWALARHQHLTYEAATPLAILGGLLLWLLRLALAPASTLAGFRAWVLAECPVAPGRRQAPRAAPEEGDQDGPVPGSGHRTARAFRPTPAQPRRLDQRRPGAPARPEHRRRPHRPAQSRSGRPERRPPMMVDLAILLAVLLIVAAFAAWAFLPARRLPGNRARRLRVRLHLRLHPGKGFAHLSSACGCAGPASRSCAAPARSAPPCPGATACWTRTSTRSSSAAPTTGTSCAFRWRSTCSSWRHHGPIRRPSWPT